MAATDRGVCFAQFGDDCESLRAQLAAEFPRARLETYAGHGEQQLERWIEALNAYIDNRRPRPDLPLDLRGTAFQVKVWEFLLGMQDGGRCAPRLPRSRATASRCSCPATGSCAATAALAATAGGRRASARCSTPSARANPGANLPGRCGPKGPESEATRAPSSLRTQRA